MAGPPKAPEPTPSAASAGGSQAGAAPAADEKFAWRQVYHKPDIAGMSALSRREEEALVKDAKAHARDVCKQFVAGPSLCLLRWLSCGRRAANSGEDAPGLTRCSSSRTPSLLPFDRPFDLPAYASCVEPRLVSALWACRAKQEEMNACLRPLCVLLRLLSVPPARTDPSPDADAQPSSLPTRDGDSMTEAVLDRMRMEYLSEKHREAYRQGPGEVRDGSRSPYSGR